jgi:hypothetical protein
LLVLRRRKFQTSRVAEWFRTKRVSVRNAAGNRVSNAPAIGARIERFPRDVFARTGYRPDYSGPQKVDHSGHLYLLRLFPSQPPEIPAR